MSAEIGTGRSVAPDLQVEDPVRMEPLVTAAEALAVFQRKLPDSVAEARAVHHPFWWAALDVRTRGLFRRSSAVQGSAWTCCQCRVRAGHDCRFHPARRLGRTGGVVESDRRTGWTAAKPGRSRADCTILGSCEGRQTVKLGMVLKSHSPPVCAVCSSQLDRHRREREAFGDHPRRRSRRFALHRAGGQDRTELRARLRYCRTLIAGWSAPVLCVRDAERMAGRVESTTQVSPGCGSARVAPSSTQRSAAAWMSSAARSRWNCL